MSDKIHPPTPRRRQRAKEQGRAPRSSDVVSAGLLLATTAMLSWYGPSLGEGLMTSLSDALEQPLPLSIDRSELIRRIGTSIVSVGFMVLPMLIAMMLCGVGLNVMQTGLMMTPSKLAPSLNSISPGARFRSILSARAIGRFGITVLKLVAVVAVAISVVRTNIPTLIGISHLPMAAIATTIFDILVSGCLWMGTTLLAFASVDYALARWQHERELMMTEQELREEMRDAERAKPPASARSQAIQGVA